MTRLLSAKQAAAKLGREPGGSFSAWLAQAAAGHVFHWQDGRGGYSRVFVDAAKVQELATMFPPRAGGRKG